MLLFYLTDTYTNDLKGIELNKARNISDEMTTLDNPINLSDKFNLHVQTNTVVTPEHDDKKICGNFK